jgi:hypothetical protein
MDDWDWVKFKAEAKRVVPTNELKPKRCWIAVLSHEKTPQAPLEETDFVWMIGHAGKYLHLMF